MSETPPQDRKASRGFPWRDLFGLAVIGLVCLTYWQGSPLVRLIVGAAGWSIFGVWVMWTVFRRGKPTDGPKARPTRIAGKIGLLVYFTLLGLLVCADWLDFLGVASSTGETLRNVANATMALCFVLVLAGLYWADNKPRHPY